MTANSSIARLYNNKHDDGFIGHFWSQCFFFRMNFEQDIYIYWNGCGQKNVKKFNVLLVYVLAVWLFSTCQQHKTNEMYMADRTNGDVGTRLCSPFQILADKLNRFQSGGEIMPTADACPHQYFWHSSAPKCRPFFCIPLVPHLSKYNASSGLDAVLDRINWHAIVPTTV